MCTLVHVTTDHFAGDDRTNRERMLAGDLYISDDQESERLAKRGVALTDANARTVVDDAAARVIRSIEP
jgi:maltose O-acetyltransferase